MRVATVDGLVTLYYDGSKGLYNRELYYEWVREYIRYAPGHEEKWESLSISDEFSIKQFRAVIRIESEAFSDCVSLAKLELPQTLEYIGEGAFRECNLVSVFIPPRCRNIGRCAFEGNSRLTNLYVPLNIDLRQCEYIIRDTKLFQRSLLSTYDHHEVNTWLKRINNDDEFALHRVCSSFEPTLDMILDVMMDKGGPQAFKVKNSIGITPSRYLDENPYAYVKEREIIEKYALKMMGEL